MSPPDNRRLNPFALPPETDVRFNLFVAVALTLTATLGFIFTVLLIRFGFLQLSVDPPGAVMARFTADSEINKAIAGQVLAEVLPWLALPIGLTLAVLGLSSLLYRLHPRYARWGRNLRQVTTEQNPQLVQTVAELARQAEVGSTPTIEIEPRLMIPFDGQIFGFPRNYTLRMDSWTPATISKTPGRFRAFVLHELAHIINQDVSRYYFALALWAAVILLGLFPLVLSGLLRLIFWQQTAPLTGINDWGYFFNDVLPRVLLVMAQAGIIFGVILAIFRSLTWVRELYADWRTAMWGAEASLVENIRSKMEGSVAKTKIWRIWIYFAPARHPAGQQRIDFLQRPEQLFTIQADLPFFVGFLIAFLVVGVNQLGPFLQLVMRGFTQVVYLNTIGALAVWLPPTGTAALIFDMVTQASLILPTYLTIISFFLAMGALIAGTLGLQVQRQTLGGMASGKPSGYWSLWPPALLLSLGIQIGFLVIPANPLAPLGSTWHSFIFHFLLAPLWIIAFGGLAWLWLGYARFFSKRILGAFSTVKPPAWPRRWLTLILGVLLWILLIPGILGQYMLADYARNPAALTDPLQQTLPWSLFYFALLVSLLLFGLIFGISFACSWLWRITRRITCSACGTATWQPYTVGRDCEHCRQPLAPWLFVNSITSTDRFVSLSSTEVTSEVVDLG